MSWNCPVPDMCVCVCVWKTHQSGGFCLSENKIGPRCLFSFQITPHNLFPWNITENSWTLRKEKQYVSQQHPHFSEKEVSDGRKLGWIQERVAHRCKDVVCLFSPWIQVLSPAPTCKSREWQIQGPVVLGLATQQAQGSWNTLWQIQESRPVPQTNGCAYIFCAQQTQHFSLFVCGPFQQEVAFCRILPTTWFWAFGRTPWSRDKPFPFIDVLDPLKKFHGAVSTRHDWWCGRGPSGVKLKPANQGNLGSSKKEGGVY